MSKITATIFCFLIYGFVHGQANKKCTEYNRCLERAANLLKNKKLEEARREYSTAKIFAKECGASDSLADKGIQAVIEKYKEQKEKAEKAQKEADLQRQNAENAKKEIELQLIKIKEGENRIQQLKESSTKQEKQFRAIVIADLLAKGQDTAAIIVDRIIVNIKESNVTEVDNPEINSDFKETINYTGSNIFSSPLFAQAKFVLDSISNLYNINHAFSNNVENEAAMLQLISRLSKDIGFNIVAKQLIDSSRNELQKLTPKAKKYDFAVYTYLLATVYYSWNLTSKGKDSLLIAKKTLDEAAAFCNSLPDKSAIIYSGMANLFSSYNNYYATIDSNRQAFDAIKTAIDYSTNAVRLNPGSYLYQLGLATLLRNITDVSDSLLSLMDKVELARLSYRYLKNMEKCFPYNNGSILTELCHSSLNLSNRLMDAGYDTNAADTLNNTIELLNQYIAKKSTAKDIKLNKLKLLIKASGIYVHFINNYSSFIKSLNESYTLFSTIKLDTADDADLIDWLVELNGSLDNLLKFAESKQDSLSAITTFSGAIKTYEKISPLGRSKYKTFSEDVNSFARPYVRRLELNILRNSKVEVDKDFAVLEKIFFPYYYKYRFDLYLGWPLIRASMLYAKYLCGQAKYKQALPLLKFASLEGSKESTDSLIAIYQKPGFANADSLKFYKHRTSYQSNGVQRFTVSTDFNGENFPFFVYITDKAKEYDTLYTGIRDQAQWLWKARRGKITDDVILNFDKLQKIAWENDVSFMDLSAYTRGAATNESVKTKEYKDSVYLNYEIEGKNILSLLTLSKQYAEKNDFVAIDKINKEINIKVAGLYNDLCWKSILSKKFNDATFYVTEGLKYDPNSVYLIGNIPHIELLTNNFGKAKILYLTYKDKPFNWEYKTYKDVFLADFLEFEKAGIVNDNIKEIIRLLNEK